MTEEEKKEKKNKNKEKRFCIEKKAQQWEKKMDEETER